VSPGAREQVDAYTERETSPDGALIVEYDIHPQRMSHETRVPRLILAATGDTLLAMSDSLYDGAVTWGEGTRLSLYLRRYDHGGGMSVEVDWGRRTIAIGASEYPLNQGAGAIDRAFRHMVRQDAPPPHAPRPDRYRAAFVVIALTLMLTGGIALTAWWFTPAPKQTLTKLPDMPSQRR